MIKLAPGDKVLYRQVFPMSHELSPQFYPADGTVGTVLSQCYKDEAYFVQWPEGATSKDDKWWAWACCLRRIGVSHACD